MRLRTRLRRTARAALARLLHLSGALHVYRAVAARRSACVLLYHRVVDDTAELVDYAPGGMSVRREAFEAQMAYLRRHYEIVPLSALVEQLAAGEPLADHLCAVTFDDGWRDNYTHAFPILKKHRVPCTIFLTTNFVQGGLWFWEERLKYVLAHVLHVYRAAAVASDGRLRVERFLRRYHAADLASRPLLDFRNALSSLVCTWRLRNAADRDAFLSELESLLELPGLRERRHFMNWDEIREMQAAGVTFGAHTRSHANLGRCDQETAWREIHGCREELAARLGAAPALFAYPFGKFSSATPGLVSEAGFAGAVTTRPDLITNGTNVFTLGRIDVHEEAASSLAVFACRAVRFLNFY